MHELLFSLLLVFLPTQLGYHFWPDWALVLGRRVDYLSPTLYLTDILIFLTIIFWLIQKKISIFNFQFSIKQRNFQSAIAKVFLILGFSSANIYFAADRMVALFAWVKILEMAALGIYIVQTKPKFSSIIFPLSVGVLYSSLLAIMQFLFQHSLGGIFWFLGERTFSVNTPGIARVDFYSLFKLRSYATFPHPNVLGGYLATMLPLLIFNFQFSIFNQTKKFSIYKTVTIILGIIALILTFSRSAWVVCVLSIVYFVFRKKNRMFFPILFFAILFIFFIGKTFGFQDESVVIRQQLNTAAISMFRASPIIGNGLGNFLVRLPAHLVSRTIYFLQPVHNIYLLILSETGMIGLVIFLWLIWKALKKEKSFIFLLLLGLADHYFLTLQQGQLLFTIFLSLSLIQ